MTDHRDSQDRLLGLRPDDHAYFKALENRVSQAHFEFCEYRELFYESDAVSVLNATAPYFFSIVQRTLITSIFTAIRGLCDPARTGKYDNISFAGLAARLHEGNHPRSELFTVLNDEYYQSAKPVCDVVSKRIAHQDVEHIIGVESTRSFGVHGDTIDKLITDAGAALDFVSNTTTIYPLGPHLNGASEIIRRLRMGV
jgi:hypothetical protein